MSQPSVLVVDVATSFRIAIDIKEVQATDAQGLQELIRARIARAAYARRS
jgi:hypothetical protein